jgi:hypothetical protein
VTSDAGLLLPREVDERLAEDPAFRMLAACERGGERRAHVHLHWVETDVLAEERNYPGLARLNTDLCSTRRPTRSRDG